MSPQDEPRAAATRPSTGMSRASKWWLLECAHYAQPQPNLTRENTAHCNICETQRACVKAV